MSGTKIASIENERGQSLRYNSRAKVNNSLMRFFCYLFEALAQGDNFMARCPPKWWIKPLKNCFHFLLHASKCLSEPLSSEEESIVNILNAWTLDVEIEETHQRLDAEHASVVADYEESSKHEYAEAMLLYGRFLTK
ncbi:hypothetical protein ACFE04_013075 [Oxalis oulophora]